MARFDLAVLLLRAVFGVSLAYHGYNKFFGPGGLDGTTGWFGSIGMRWPRWQARLAATTEVGAGLLFATGLLTPFAAAGIIGLMVVAIVVAHWKVGFFIFKPDQGWEYCASIAVVALAVAVLGPQRWSFDHALGIEINSWWGPVIALGGIAAALAQLTISYRPPRGEGD